MSLTTLRHNAPWEGLGSEIDEGLGTQEILEKASLDWEVERVPVFCSDVEDAIPGKYAIRRATDRVVYDIVSDRFKPVQNREIVDFFREWTEAGSAVIDCVGSMRNGRQVWAMARLGTGFTLPGGDAVDGYVMLVGSHEAGRSTRILTTTVRMVCTNMLHALSHEADTEVRWTHARDFDPAQAREQLGVSREAVGTMEGHARDLLNLQLSERDAVRVLSRVFQPRVRVEDAVSDENMRVPSVQAILWANQKAPGAVPGTGWGLLNATTYFIDHMTKTKTPDGRFFAANLGHQAENKKKVYKELLEMAAY